MARSVPDKLFEEIQSALFVIVRQNAMGHPIGHDAMIAARSVVRRLMPDAYADLVRRTGRDLEADRQEGGPFAVVCDVVGDVVTIAGPVESLDGAQARCFAEQNFRAREKACYLMTRIR